ncbi:MAG TPA: alpha/beta hydrolase [Vicinamibacterales bacterium]|nr:alpha/beta hydrolase [Vicinamibacterales bacterium]
MNFPTDDADSIHGTSLTRRRVLQGLIAAMAPLVLAPRAPRAQAAQAPGAPIGPLDPGVLPAGVRSRFVDGVNGLRMHVLEAGYETPGRPALLLIHGYPELAYSWRKVMGPLASAGYHVFAPDVRGYGRTTPAPVNYTDDLRPYGSVNKMRDMLALVSAMGYRSVAAVIGHDQGSPLAGWCACARPDIFRAVAMMSAPFGGPPALPFNTANTPRPAAPPVSADAIYEDLARLSPPRKHYQRYYQTRDANENMWHASQGLQAFIRAYYHMKSADWTQNDPHPLAARTAAEWGKLPRYYVMDLDKGMAEQVASEMPTPAQIAANRWLPDAELRVYVEEYGRTGFQGGLNGYRGSPGDADLQLFAGRTIDVPSTFMGGKQDWGVYQNPGALDRLEKNVTTKYAGTHLVDGAGHWVQQEQPEAISRLLVDFLKRSI